jgi:DNA-binding PadR family transcriptional regulator
LVLAALVAGPKHGYAIICDIETQTGKRLGPGTLYGIIARLEKNGLIKALRVEDRGRRPYSITPAGKRAFEEQVQSLAHYQRALRSLAAG